MKIIKVGRVCSNCGKILKNAFQSCPICKAHFRGENKTAKPICSVCGGDFPYKDRRKGIEGRNCPSCGRNLNDMIIICEKDDCGKIIEMVYNQSKKTYHLKGT